MFGKTLLNRKTYAVAKICNFNELIIMFGVNETNKHEQTIEGFFSLVKLHVLFVLRKVSLFLPPTNEILNEPLVKHFRITEFRHLQVLIVRDASYRQNFQFVKSITFHSFFLVHEFCK